ncbi:MAG: hypothetical protein HC802_04385 [Caldilineaceae bacterium]|nr:hypothetical protein [Caldilineaceae bacterium]
MPDTRRAEVDLPASNFLMVPYSNRIEAGRFNFDGRAYQLAHGERHSIHGDVRGHPWHVAFSSETELRCTFRSTELEQINWPWPFDAEVTYTLIDNRVVSEMSLWNRGVSPMRPAFGWHPYFSRWLSRSGEAVLLEFSVQGVYPDANGNRIPSGPPQPLSAHQDFSKGRALPADRFLDGCFAGYDGNGQIAWPESGVSVRFRCSPELGHLILYNPDKPYFAVEPVTNANNGVNLFANGEPSSGVRVLAPDAALTATFEMQIETAPE